MPRLAQQKWMAGGRLEDTLMGEQAFGGRDGKPEEQRRISSRWRPHGRRVGRAGVQVLKAATAGTLRLPC